MFYKVVENVSIDNFWCWTRKKCTPKPEKNWPEGSKNHKMADSAV